MVAAKKLCLLFALQCLLVSNVTTGSKTNSRQLDIPAMKSYFEQTRLKDSKRTAATLSPDVGSGEALQPDVRNGQFQPDNSCGVYSVNCSDKTLLLGGATNTMSVRRPDNVSLGTPIRIPTNGYQTSANHQQKVLNGRYGTLSTYRTIDKKPTYTSDWTPISYVKQSPSPPPIYKPSALSLGVPIKTPTNNNFHARTNYKGVVKNLDGTLGKFTGHNNGRDNLNFGKPIKWSASDPNSSAPSFRNFGQQGVSPPQLKPFKASTPIVTTNKNKETKGDLKPITNNSQRSNGNSPGEVQHVLPSPGVDFSGNVPNTNNDVSIENPIQTSSDFDSGIIPISLLPLAPISEFANPNEKDPSPILKVKGDPAESIFNIHTTKKSTTPNSQTLILDNFNDGRYDDIGVVSSFSYFHHPEWSKGFEEYFTTQAGGKIAKQFHSNMFDHTGFPGRVRKNPTAKETKDSRDAKETQFAMKKKRNELDYIRRMQNADKRKTLG